MSTTPHKVPHEEWPDVTPENVPEDVLQRALGLTVRFGRCPHCDESQFYVKVSGQNTVTECRQCDEWMDLVG